MGNWLEDETNLEAVNAFARWCLRREKPLALAINTDGDVLVSDRNVCVGVFGGEPALLPSKAKRPAQYTFCSGERIIPDLWRSFTAWRDSTEEATPLTPTGLLTPTGVGLAWLFATGAARDAATRFVRVERRYLRLLPGGQVRCWDGAALVLVVMPMTMDRADGRTRFTLEEVMAGHVLPQDEEARR